MLNVILTGSFSFLITFLSIPVIIRVAEQKKLFDLPDARKLHIRHIEIRPEDRSREQAKGAGQSVDPVDQVESIDDNNDGGIRQHQAEGLRQLMDAEKSMHAVDADMRQVDQDRGCDHLPQKLFQGTQDHDIILKSQKEDDGGRCEKILEVRVL